MILAKTVKGWTLGAELEARNATHQIKKLGAAELKAFRDRLYLADPRRASSRTATRRTATRARTRPSTST